MARTTLTLVRHGESDVTVRQVFGGERSCTGLSALGVQQAEALRDRLRRTRELSVDRLWSSTLPRAIETAEVLAPALGDLDLCTDPELQELRPGPEADGTPFGEYEERFGVFDQWDEPHRPIAPGGESLAEFQHRVGRALFAVADEAVGQSVLIVCHGGVIDGAFRSLLGYSHPVGLFSLNTSITQFQRSADGDGPHRWALVRYNDAGHLEGLLAKTERDAQ